MADPTTIPDLRLWLKADSIAAGTTSVSSWANSAPGFTAETVDQSVAAKQPVLNATAINGLPALGFDGTDDYFDMTGALLDIFRNLGGVTLFAVGMHDDPTTTSTTAHQSMNFLHQGKNGSTAARVSFAMMKSTAAAQEDSFRYGGRRLDADSFDHTATANDSWPRLEWKIATADVVWSASNLHLYLNGSLGAEDLAFQTDGLSSDTVASGGAIGAATSKTAEFVYGSIAEILVYRRSLTAEERAQVHVYLSDRYGIPVADRPVSTFPWEGLGSRPWKGFAAEKWLGL